MKLTFTFLLILIVLSTNAQKNTVDSLKIRLKESKENKEKVTLLNSISDELAEVDFKTSLLYADSALGLAQKINFKLGMAQAYMFMANAYSAQSDYIKCLELNHKALEITQEIRDDQQMGKLFSNIGNVYNDQGNFTKALTYYNQSLEFFKKSDDKIGVARLYNNIGNAYANKGDLKQSVEYLFKSLKIKEELGNKKAAANTCNNIAVVCKIQGNYAEALRYNELALKYRIELADSNGIGFSYTNIGLAYRNLKKNALAEEYLLKAQAIFNRLGYAKGVATASNNLGIIYKTKGDYVNALKAYRLALEKFEEQNDKPGIASSLANLASIYGKNKNYKEAEDYFTKAESMALETKSFEIIMNVYELRSEYCEEKNDYQNALKYQLLYSQNRDSLVSKENGTAIAEMKTRYETEIKQTENENLKSENKIKDLIIDKKNTQRNAFILLFVGTILLATVLFNWFRLKKRDELNQQLIIQQELRSKAMIETEEKERTRIARELHDGVGQQLSAARLNIAGLQTAIKIKNQEEQSMLQNAIDLLDESVKEIRGVSHSMMPNALIKSGLVSAVREFINKISSSGSLKINLEIVGFTERLEQNTESVLFRILQELVNNIIKHANATEVSIQLIRHAKELTIMVEDNGIGFDIEKNLRDVSGIGLKNIQSRVDYLNGQVFFDSQPNKGTTVTVEIPIA